MAKFLNFAKCFVRNNVCEIQYFEPILWKIACKMCLKSQIQCSKDVEAKINREFCQILRLVFSENFRFAFREIFCFEFRKILCYISRKIFRKVLQTVGNSSLVFLIRKKIYMILACYFAKKILWNIACEILKFVRNWTNVFWAFHQ